MTKITDIVVLIISIVVFVGLSVLYIINTDAALHLMGVMQHYVVLTMGKVVGFFGG